MLICVTIITTLFVLFSAILNNVAFMSFEDNRICDSDQGIFDAAVQKYKSGKRTKNLLNLL